MAALALLGWAGGGSRVWGASSSGGVSAALQALADVFPPFGTRCQCCPRNSSRCRPTAWPGRDMVLFSIFSGSPAWGAPVVKLRHPPTVRDPRGLLPTDGDAVRAAGLSQLHGLRSFSFGDRTKLSDIPRESSGEKSRSLEVEDGGGSAPSPHPMALPLLPLAVLPLPVFVRGTESSSPRASIPQGKKNRKGDTEGKEAGNERTETLYQPHVDVERGRKNPLKRVLTSLEASGTRKITHQRPHVCLKTDKNSEPKCSMNI